MQSQTTIHQCPECEEEIDVTGELMLGELVICDGCGLDLEVTSIEPLQFELAPEIEEDWGE